MLYPPAGPTSDSVSAGGSIRLHLFNMLDGSPYRMPPSNIITWELPPRSRVVDIDTLEMTASRVMIFVNSQEEIGMKTWRMASWDWETGRSVRGLWSL